MPVKRNVRVNLCIEGRWTMGGMYVPIFIKHATGIFFVILRIYFIHIRYKTVSEINKIHRKSEQIHRKVLENCMYV